MTRHEYLNNLPKKISSAGVLFFNESEEVLCLGTTYKEDLEIPGGIIEQNESPKQAAEREVKEELGIGISLGDLLVCEHQITEDFECYAFVFDGGVLSENQIKSFQLGTDEIKKIHFLDTQMLSSNIKPQLKHRIQKSIQAREDDKVVYYETDYR